MITHQGKNNPEKFSGNGYQGLDLGHSLIQMSLIDIVHYAPFTNRIKGGKKKNFSQKRSAPLGDMTIPFMLSRTDFKKVQSSQFQDFSNRMKFAKIPDLSDQPGCGNLSYSFQRQNRMTIGDLGKKDRHLLFYFLNKFVGKLDLGKQFLYLPKNRLAAFLKAYRVLRGLIKGLGSP